MIHLDYGATQKQQTTGGDCELTKAENDVGSDLKTAVDPLALMGTPFDAIGHMN